jgi:hypothetical protein
MSVFSIQSKYKPGLTKKIWSASMQWIVWCPTFFEMDPCGGRPTGGAALLLTNQAVASNVPFAAKYPLRVVVSCLASEVYYCN